MVDRSVVCAWCSAEIHVGAPDLGGETYFVLPRRCHACAGNNVIELIGAIATVAKIERKRKRVRVDNRPTHRIRPQALRRAR